MKYDEAIKILGNVSLDYTGMNQEEIDQMDEALTLAFNAMSILSKNNNLEERIKELEKELEESRAKEGKGALEIAIENFGQLFSSINEALGTMPPEEIKELLRPDEGEEE